MRLGKPPAGYGHWTLQLLADELVALQVVDSISHETVINAPFVCVFGLSQTSVTSAQSA